MSTGTSVLFYADKASRRKQAAILAVAAVLVLLASLCVGVDSPEFYGPDEVLRCYALLLSSWVGEGSFDPQSMLAIEPHCFQVLNRLIINVVTFVCGAMLAVAGSVYQLAFRNPVAAPTMLGATNGVRLGVLVAVMTLGSTSADLVSRSYWYALGFAVVIILIVFGVARLIAPRSRGGAPSVVDMLLVGTILSSLTGAVITYVQDFVMTSDQYDLFVGLSEALTVNVDLSTGLILAVVFVLTMVPLFVCRFSMNLMSLEDHDARMLGLSVQWVRIGCILLATLMMVVCQILVGTVAMVCLVVPHISRMAFGANFARQLPANMLIGALLLAGCRLICSLIPFTGYGMPLGTVVSVVVLPAFVWIVALQQRRWVVE